MSHRRFTLVGDWLERQVTDISDMAPRLFSGLSERNRSQLRTMNRLPKSLIDLLCAQSSRALYPNGIRRCFVGKKWLHQVTQDSQHNGSLGFNWSVFETPPDSEKDSSTSKLTVIEKTELEAKIEKLKTILEIEETKALESSSLSEQDLQAVYKDILSLPDTPGSVAPPDPEDIQTNAPQVVSRGREQIIPLLQQRFNVSPLTHLEQTTLFLSMDNELRASLPAVLDAIKVFIDELHSMKKLVGSSKSTVPVIVLTSQEWRDLVRSCVELHAFDEAETVLSLFKTFDPKQVELEMDLVDNVLEAYAASSDVTRAISLTKRFCPAFPRQSQRDLLLETYVRAAQVGGAISILHDFEERGIPASVKGYTAVIKRLAFSRPRDIHSTVLEGSPPEGAMLDISRPSPARLHARAWDLFSHMRYVAHPTPDLRLYSLMISLCGLNPLGKSEPERAMDLWYEMVHQAKLVPDTRAYSSLLRVLAHAVSLDHKWAHEAWRVAREMWDSSRDAEGNMYPHLKPNSTLFESLLEVCKKMGDLLRCRWVLAELLMPKNNLKVTQLSMIHVFHCYGTYLPPKYQPKLIHASDAIATKDTSTANVEEPKKNDHALPSEASSSGVPLDHADTMPLTRSQIIKEADRLFERLVKARELPELMDKRSRVYITNKLITAYLVVHVHHSPFARLQTHWNATWQRFNEIANKDSRAFVLGLERCAMKPKSERHKREALNWAREMWREWIMYQERIFNEAVGSALQRRIERIWSAYIKILALNDKTEEALEIVLQFFKKYPPRSMRTPPTPFFYDSTKPVLVSNRPLVRLTAPHEIGDDTVPPMLTFLDVETLHQRLVIEGNEKAIRTLTFVLRSYQFSLRKRKKETLLTTPEKRAPPTLPPLITHDKTKNTKSPAIIEPESNPRA